MYHGYNSYVTNLHISKTASASSDDKINHQVFPKRNKNQNLPSPIFPFLPFPPDLNNSRNVYESHVGVLEAIHRTWHWDCSLHKACHCDSSLLLYFKYQKGQSTKLLFDSAMLYILKVYHVKKPIYGHYIPIAFLH
ncbi:hypothetical protein LXL04_004927 [Taraxacum kok-saghyz]